MLQRWTCACHPATPDAGAAAPSRRGFLGGLGAISSAGLAGLLTGCGTGGRAAAAAGAAPRRIDVHHHVVPPAYAAELKSRGLGNAPKWSPQMSIEDMDANGIATSLLSLMNPAANFNDAAADRRMARLSNDYAAQMARDFPGRFGSFATLPLLDTDGSLREIAYAFDTLKAEGIGLMTSYGDQYLGDRRFWPIWEELNRRKAVVYTHPLQPGCCRNPIEGLPSSAIEFPADTTRSIASLLFTGAANRYPDIRWIWSHSGGTMPFLWARFTRQEADLKDKAKAVVPNGVLAEVQRFYYDTAQAHHEGAIAALRVLVPPEKILFGSDFPYRKAEDVRVGLAERSFSRAELDAIERGNALRLMPSLRRS
jgi:predicted TIM-barrel fold metal-dependent hydrolase